MSRCSRGTAASLGLVLLSLVIACSGPVEPSATIELNGEDSGKTIEVRLGQEIEVTLQTIGPGEYETPSISSSALRFVDVVAGPIIVPAGPTQIFRFDAERTGSATITIAHTQNNPEFSVEIVVR